MILGSYVLAASADGDRRATFLTGDRSVELTVQDWGGYVGQWDNRVWRQVPEPVPPEPAANDTSIAARRARRTRERITTNGRRMLPEFSGTLTPGFIKRAPVAWFASHHHTADGTNDPYAFAYLFAYPMDLPANATSLTLPDDDRIRVLAVTVSDEGERVQPAMPLYDVLGGERR